MNGDEQLLRGRVYGCDDDPGPGPFPARTYATFVAEHRKLLSKLSPRGDVWREVVASGIRIARMRIPLPGLGYRRRGLGPHHQEEPVSCPQPLTPEETLADAKRLLSLPRIVVICGSTRFMAEMTEADLRETKVGKIVVKPACDMKSPHELWSDPVEAEALKVRLDDLHRAKIRLADEVLVVGDYIGDSTRAEIAYARSLGKPVRFTHPDVDPDA